MADLILHLGTEDLHITAEKGDLISDLLLKTEYAITMPCSGHGRCGKCKIKAVGALSAPTKAEIAALSETELLHGTRLACCTHIEGCAEITPISAPSLEGIRLEGKMPRTRHKPRFKRYGAAIDIGTTTLAARLYKDDSPLATAAAANPQSRLGADVISRVEKALNGYGTALATAIRRAVTELLEKLARDAGIAIDDIDALVITGNTAMLYLFTEHSTACLAHSPFLADELYGKSFAAQDLGLPLKDAVVYLPRCISAFLGADITAALLASEICESRHTAMLADIGTNGEMALWHNGSLLCCSTAAGPAFEGAGLSMGVQGVAGAIDYVAFDKALPLTVHTIGELPARGICGSGIVAALAAMKSADIMDETGYLEHDEEQYYLTDSVAVTQRDIRMVQLAKSAVCAGMYTLLDIGGVAYHDIKRLAIAGGFGSYLNLDSAAAIGLFPSELRAKAEVLGNAALDGAAMLLLDSDLAQKSANMANAAKIADLATSKIFAERYIDCMSF